MSEQYQFLLSLQST